MRHHWADTVTYKLYLFKPLPEPGHHEGPISLSKMAISTFLLYFTNISPHLDFHDNSKKQTDWLHPSLSKEKLKPQEVSCFTQDQPQGWWV